MRRGGRILTVPDYETLMLPVLKITADGCETIPEAIPSLVEKFGLTPEEASQMLPSGKQTVIANRAHWARNYMSHAGLVTQKKRGHYEISPDGKTLLASAPDRIDKNTLLGFSSFAQWYSKSVSRKRYVDADEGTESNASDGNPEKAIETATPEEVIDSAAHAIETELASSLLLEVLGLSPVRFERLILDLLRAMGYGGGADSMYRETAQSGDGGIDGIIDEDALGLDAVYIQAKRYAPENKIGREALQAFVGSLTGEGASKGVFVTTSDFSQPARDYVHRVQQRVVLINGDRLARLMIAHEVGVRARQTYVIRSVDEDYFADPT